ncbi:MAG: hypothetical protein ABI140_02160 [Jatrophihabitantaceae bacterium]
MSARKWVPTVLRARQAQEDLVAQRVALARRDAGLALSQLGEHTARLANMVTASSRTALEFQAEVARQQAAAATVAAAANRLMFAEARLATGVGELTEAARARRSVEKLSERDEQDRLSTATSAAQREQDEVSISRHNAERRAAG